MFTLSNSTHTANIGVCLRSHVQVKVYMADFSSATNVLPLMAFLDDAHVYDKVFTSAASYQKALQRLSELGVATARKAQVLDTGRSRNAGL